MLLICHFKLLEIWPHCLFWEIPLDELVQEGQKGLISANRLKIKINKTLSFLQLSDLVERSAMGFPFVDYWLSNDHFSFLLEAPYCTWKNVPKFGQCPNRGTGVGPDRTSVRTLLFEIFTNSKRLLNDNIPSET